MLVHHIYQLICTASSKQTNFVSTDLSLYLLTPGVLHVLALDPYAWNLKGFLESFLTQSLWKCLRRLQLAADA